MSVIIGIDPHKATHTAVASESNEQPIARLQVVADRCQTQRLLAWAAPFGERTWAIESASGLGKLLAQQLLGAGEHVVDVPPTLSARVRLLGSSKAGKDDSNDEEGWHQLPNGTFLTVRFKDPNVLRNLRFRDQLVGDRRIHRGELGRYRLGHSRFR